MRTWPLVLAALSGCDYTSPIGALLDQEVDAAAPAIDATPDAPPMFVVAGVEYRLRASGTANVIDGRIGDSEYVDFADPKDLACCEDVGIGIDDPMVDKDTRPDWGPYAADHIYEITMLGTGAPIRATYQDTVYGNNIGNLTVEIFAIR